MVRPLGGETKVTQNLHVTVIWELAGRSGIVLMETSGSLSRGALLCFPWELEPGHEFGALSFEGIWTPPFPAFPSSSVEAIYSGGGQEIK